MNASIDTAAAAPTGYVAWDEGAAVHFPDADTAEEAAEAFVAGGNWGDSSKTAWVDVRTAPARGPGEDEDYLEECEGVWYDSADEESITITIEPDVPECPHPDPDSEDGHDWRAPVALVGGCRENPGCFGHGGGVVSSEVCVRCGARRTTDTWAQDPSTGQQGLTSVEYEEAGTTDIEAALEERRLRGDFDRETIGEDEDGEDVVVVEGAWGWWGAGAGSDVRWYLSDEDGPAEVQARADAESRIVETWALDTCGDGSDENGLVGSEDDVWADVAHHHDCQEDELKDRGWTLTRE